MKQGIVTAAAAIGMTLASPAMAQDGAGNAQAEASAQAEVAAKAAAVQRHVDAYRSRDLDRFVATFTADAEVYANGMVAVGHKQIRAMYALNFAPGSPRIKIKDSGMSGPFVYLTTAYVTADGQELCCSHSEYEVIDGKISYLSASG